MPHSTTAAFANWSSALKLKFLHFTASVCPTATTNPCPSAGSSANSATRSRSIFLASEKQLRPNRNGNLYLQLDLADRSGSISARMWNASEQDFRAFENGDYVRITGNTQLFQGSLQLIATSIIKVDSAQINPEDFETLSARQIDKLAVRLAEHLRRIAQPHLAALAEAYLMDQEFMRKFAAAPAGVKNHHAYAGGLVEHVVSLLELVGRIDGLYPDLDTDLLRIGAFLHDAGKIDGNSPTPTKANCSGTWC